MITTVTLNPAIDKTVILDELNKGGVNRIKDIRVDMGGKGINVAKILASLGDGARALGFIGKKNLGEVEELIKDYGIDTDFVVIDAATRVNTKVIDSSTQETTDLNEAGFLVGDSKLKEVMAHLAEDAKSSEFVVLSGSAPKGVSASVYKEMILAVKQNAKVVLDAEGPLLLEALEAGPSIIKPNIHELEAAIGRKLETDDAVVEVAREWIEKYGIEYVLVSMGGDGSLLIGRDKTLKSMPIKVDVKGTVGAGDSMVAGFVHGLMHGSLDRALAYGAACGTLAVSRAGTEVFSMDEVEEMLKRVEIVEL